MLLALVFACQAIQDSRADSARGQVLLKLIAIAKPCAGAPGLLSRNSVLLAFLSRFPANDVGAAPVFAVSGPYVFGSVAQAGSPRELLRAGEGTIRISTSRPIPDRGETSYRGWRVRTIWRSRFSGTASDLCPRVARFTSRATVIICQRRAPGAPRSLIRSRDGAPRASREAQMLSLRH
jgi:hypothetical protein